MGVIRKLELTVMNSVWWSVDLDVDLVTRTDSTLRQSRIRENTNTERQRAIDADVTTRT